MATNNYTVALAAIGATVAALVGYGAGVTLSQKKRDDDYEHAKKLTLIGAAAALRPKDEQLVFYNSDLCPFGQRAWLTLLEKNIPFKYVPVDLFNKDQEFLDVNPKGEVPALVHKNHNYYESIPLIEYLEDAYPNISLLPDSPNGKYKYKMFVKKHEGVIPLMYQALTAQDKGEQTNLLRNLDNALVAFDKDIVGPYVLGKNFTLADIIYLPFFKRMEIVLGHFREWKIDPNNKKILEWIRLCEQRDSYKKTSAPRTEESMKKTPYYREKQYIPYLIEVYTPYAYNKKEDFKRLYVSKKAPLTNDEINELLGRRNT